MALYLNISFIDFEMVGLLSLTLERKDKPLNFQTEIHFDSEIENILNEIS